VTLAICLKCGAHRIGAITPCAVCGQASSVVFGIDVTFIGVSVDRSTLRCAATVLDSLALPTVELELRSREDRLNERDGSPWGALLLAAVGLAVAWVGLRIETYSIPWYQDVRAILVVGLGFMLTGIGLQELPGWLRGVFRSRASEHRPR